MTSWVAKPLSENERLVLDVVRRHEPIARAAVTAKTPLTQPWVHRLVDQLVARELLVCGPAAKGGRGQPSVTLSVSRSAAFSLGVAVGTDAVNLCLCDLSCRVLQEVQLRAAPVQRKTALKNIAEALGQLLKAHGVPRERVVGVGVSLPGFFVRRDGARQVNAPEPLRDWSLIELQPELEEAFDFPVTIENNATASAIGENLIGVGRWARSFCYLDFGYGFGSGLVIDGKPYVGRHGNAGEIVIEPPNTVPASRPALRYLLEELRAQGVRVESVGQIVEHFNPNWPGVDRWVERVQPKLDRVVNTVASLLDPDAIVFGGELPMALGLQLISNTRFWDVQHRYGVAPPRPRLVLAEGGSRAAPVGAALGPLSAVFF